MRASILMAMALIGIAVGPVLAASKQSTSGQCRDAKGSFVACGQGAAATDSEGVPLAAKASVIRKSTAEQTSAVMASPPGEATARCRDGTYSASKRRAADLARADGGGARIK